jgi:hypothetical protein
VREGVSFVWSNFDATNNAWTVNAGNNNFSKTRRLPEGEISLVVKSGATITVRSTAMFTGMGRFSNSTSILEMTLVGRTNLTPGLIGLRSIIASGSGRIDSFNSEDPAKSTFGMYDRNKATAEAFLATIENTSTLEISGRLVHGYIGAPLSATITLNPQASVGDALWASNPANLGRVQPGHLITDFRENYRDVRPDFAGIVPRPGMVNGTNYIYVLSDGDYTLATLNMGSSQRVLVNGSARLLVEDKFTMGGSAAVFLAPGASLELFCPGDIIVAGTGIVNANGRAKNLMIYGYTPSNKERVEIAGSADFIGRIYAPGKRVVLAGTAEFFGALLAEKVTIGGSHDVHFDEALGARISTEYSIVSWKKL